MSRQIIRWSPVEQRQFAELFKRLPKPAPKISVELSIAVEDGGVILSISNDPVIPVPPVLLVDFLLFAISAVLREKNGHPTKNGQNKEQP